MVVPYDDMPMHADVFIREKRSSLSERSTLNEKAGSMPPCRYCICTVNELRYGETPKSILTALCQNRRLTSVATLTASLACSFLSTILPASGSLHLASTGTNPANFPFSPPIHTLQFAPNLLIHIAKSPD